MPAGLSRFREHQRQQPTRRQPARSLPGTFTNAMIRENALRRDEPRPRLDAAAQLREPVHSPQLQK